MFEVRQAVADDAEAIARVHVSSWQSAYRGILTDEYLDALRWSDRYGFWAAELATSRAGGGGTWVTLLHDEVIGFAAAGPTRDEDLDPGREWELYAIYVMPDAWGRGVGRQLLQHVMDAMPPRVEGMSLWVLEENSRARQFYEGFGLLLDGSELVIDIGGTPLKELRYRKALSRSSA